MKTDMLSGPSTLEMYLNAARKPPNSFYLDLESRKSSGEDSSPLPQFFPPPPPPPTRESSVPPSGLVATSSPRLGVNAIPRRLPDLKSCRVLAKGTSFMKSSGIRGTLPRLKKLEVRRQRQIPLADLLLSNECLTSVKERKSTSVQHADEIKHHQQDAARALLVLKQSSAKVADMTKRWSHSNIVPLCDFIVAQKNCQIMLENIETLKDARIQLREATAVEDYEDDKIMRHVLNGKRRRKGFYRARSSRSSSIVSIVNVIKKECEIEARSRSNSSECTVTKSPTEVDSDLPNHESQSSPQLVATYDEPDSGSPPIDDRKALGKIGKTSKSGKNRNTHMKCLQCSATDTPEWRKGPVGPTTLCNACGLFYKKLLKRFGGDTAGVIMKMRQVKNPQDRKVPRSVTSQ